MTWMSLLLIPHFAFGLVSGDYQVTVNGELFDTVHAPNGSVVFDGPEHGDFAMNLIVPNCDADLIVTDVDVPIPVCLVSGRWEARFRIQNIGTVAAPACSSQVRFKPPGGTDTIKCNQPIPALAPGAKSEVLVCKIADLPVAPGSYDVTFIADYLDTVPESNENNNRY